MAQDLKKLIRTLEAQGFVVVSTKRHTKMKHPDGRTVVLSSSLGKGRAFANTMAQLRRSGVEL